MEQFSVTTYTKAMLDTLLSRLTAEVGEEVAALSDDNSVILTSENEAKKEKIVDTISKAIVEEYENKLISKLINQNYFYFNLPDKRAIFKKALNYAGNEGAYDSLIRTRLKEYLDTADRLMIDGFVNFRLKDYQSELEDIIDKAVDDFMVEKEYREFIKLLKYFVDIQEPKHELINIIPDGEKYIICDGAGTDITAMCAGEFVRDDNAEHINSDDLLISSLISIAPQRICIHRAEQIENEELMSTIRQVFLDKVITCSGCGLCLKN